MKKQRDYTQHIEDYKKELELRRTAQDIHEQGMIGEKKETQMIGCLVAGIGLVITMVIILIMKWKGTI